MKQAFKIVYYKVKISKSSEFQRKNSSKRKKRLKYWRSFQWEKFKMLNFFQMVKNSLQNLKGTQLLFPQFSWQFFCKWVPQLMKTSYHRNKIGSSNGQKIVWNIIYIKWNKWEILEERRSLLSQPKIKVFFVCKMKRKIKKLENLVWFFCFTSF